MIVCVYHMLSSNSPFRDLGEDYIDKRDTQRAARRYVRRLRDLGFPGVWRGSPRASLSSVVVANGTAAPAKLSSRPVPRANKIEHR